MAIRILIVDDEPEMERLMLQQFRRKLRKGEYECWFVQNGQDALKSLQENPELDVILCDINMPEMDGLTFISHLREMHTLAKPVMVSAYGNMGNIRTAMNRGAFDFVTKPIDFEDLELTIEKAMGEVSQLREAEATAQKLVVTEQQLSESAERENFLRELDELKNRFFTHISHEFRTPLTVILGMAEQVESNPEKWREKGLAMIRQHGSNLLDLINQLLELRKLESGNLGVNYVLGDVISYLQYLVASFESIAEIKGLKLDFQTEITELVMDHDPDKLLRIVTNLLSNAIKFTQEGGEISVQCAVGSVQSKNPMLPTANSLLLTISDTGKGIPQEKIENIFDSFYQVNEEGSGENQGTGIGLTLTKELVKLMGGEIAVESAEGKGTTFTLSFPIHTEATPLPNAFAAVPAHAFHLSETASQLIAAKTKEAADLPSLLIIEDNLDITQYLYACLEGKYRLLSAKDGQEGIEKAFEHGPDLIISDLMMPRKNGYEVCATLKEDVRTSHIPIVLLTAKADQEARIAGYQQGADAYLAKPFDKKELFVRLEQLLQLRQKLQMRYRSAQGDTFQPETNREDAFILKIQDILEKNLLNTSFGIPELCKEIGMSRSQLHNKIKALTGRSTSLYLRFLRLNKAKSLLQNPDLNISEVAYQVGFNDPRYFTRSYVQEFGEAPSRGR